MNSTRFDVEQYSLVRFHYFLLLLFFFFTKITFKLQSAGLVELKR